MMKRLKAALLAIVLAVTTHISLVGPAHATPIYGLASFYKHGVLTANGERFDPQAFTAAHRSLPFGTLVRVENVNSGKSVVVRINDRGPFVGKRVIDLSYAAARAVGLLDMGVGKVKLEVLGQASP